MATHSSVPGESQGQASLVGCRLWFSLKYLLILLETSSTAVLFRGVWFNFQVLRDFTLTSLLLISSLY